MQRTRVALTSLFLLTTFGCASQGDVESLRRDNDELKNRIFAMEKGLNEVRGDVKERMEKTLSGYRRNLDALEKEVAGYQKDMASIRKGGADLQATLDSARVDMQVLTGKIDDVRIMAQKPADDLALLKEDLSKRLAAIDERLTKLENAAPQQQSQPSQTQQTPEGMYQQGYAAIKAGDTAKGRETLSKFLEAHPKDKLAANAHYWIAESYYSEKNFDQAILEFQEVIKNFPKSDKVPAALLKQGMAFKEAGDPKSAAYVYKKLTEQFPKSEEAKVAREKLRVTK